MPAPIHSQQFLKSRGHPTKQISPKLTNTLKPTPTPVFSYRPNPSNKALFRSPSNTDPQVWHGTSSPDRGQEYSKVIPALGRGIDNHIHKSHLGPRSGLGQTAGLHCRSCPPMKASQRRAKRNFPDVWCYGNSGKDGLTHSRLQKFQICPLTTKGPNTAQANKESHCRKLN